jgi:hypothetical protein
MKVGKCDISVCIRPFLFRKGFERKGQPVNGSAISHLSLLTGLNLWRFIIVLF